MSVLSVHNLKKIYPAKRSIFGRVKQPAFQAVDDISFSLQQGEVLGFLGPNGSGKTTTIHMLLDLLTPTSGRIMYFGKNFYQHKVEILESIGFGTTYAKLPGRLTVYDNLHIYGMLYNIAKAERTDRIKELLTFFGIWHLRDKETSSLSAGQATRVMLTKTFLSKPRIVLLDEPTAALDPDVATLIRQFVKEQREQGVSFLFTSHNMFEVTEICNRVLVLKDGNIIANNTPSELTQTISHAHVNLYISDNLEILTAFTQEHNIAMTQKGKWVECMVPERDIATFLTSLADRKIIYSHITINKPTLEDYFLTLKEQS
jgi:ABC-2 type transport system ATP-binding protein